MASVAARDYGAGGMTSLSRHSTADSRRSISASSPSRDVGPVPSPGNFEEETDILSPASTASTIPPYWHTPKTHQRSSSTMSADSLPAGAITLRDNEENEDNDRNNACWAKSVEIVDYIVVNGSATNIGAFVVWIIRVETLTVGSMLSRGCHLSHAEC